MRAGQVTIAVIVAAVLFGGSLSACGPTDGFEDVEQDADWTGGGKADSASGPVTIVEIGDDFVELRNDGQAAIDLDGWYLSFSRRRVRFSPHRSREHVVEPGGLAIVIDSDTPVPSRVPEWTPVLDLSQDIENLLAHSKSLILRSDSKVVSDRIDGRSKATRGIALERRLKTRVALSVLGSTPGSRNAIHDDAAIRTSFANPLVQTENPLPAELAAFIDSAVSTVDAALYQLDHPDVIDAFIAAAERGAAVRLVTDSTYLEHPDYIAGYQALADAGVPIVGDGRTARQHNKFVVVDGRAVWTGSFNPLDTPKFIDADNVVTIESRAVAAMFTAELEEMFSGKFGPKKADDGNHVAYVDGAKVEVYFSPTDRPVDVILAEIGRAKSNVYFSSFAFYMDTIGDAMVERHAAGVDVRGTLDRRSATATSQYPVLLDAGVDIRRPYYDALLHHKFIIVDYGTADPVVITGSYNLSSKAETQNDEAVIVIHDPYVAGAYYGVWSRLYDSCSGDNTDTTGLAPVSLTEVFPGDAGGKPWVAPAPGFVELANVGDTTASIEGLVLRDRDGETRVLTGTIAAGDRAVIDVAGMNLEFSDPLMLVDQAGRIVSRFDRPGYHGAGRTMERQSLWQTDDDAQWRPSDETGGTPGR